MKIPNGFIKESDGVYRRNGYEFKEGQIIKEAEDKTMEEKPKYDTLENCVNKVLTYSGQLGDCDPLVATTYINKVNDNEYEISDKQNKNTEAIITADRQVYYSKPEIKSTDAKDLKLDDKDNAKAPKESEPKTEPEELKESNEPHTVVQIIVNGKLTYKGTYKDEEVQGLVDYASKIYPNLVLTEEGKYVESDELSTTDKKYKILQDRLSQSELCSKIEEHLRGQDNGDSIFENLIKWIWMDYNFDDSIKDSEDSNIDPQAQSALWDLVDNNTYGDRLVNDVCTKYNISKELAYKVINDYKEYKTIKANKSNLKEDEESIKVGPKVKNDVDLDEEIEPEDDFTKDEDKEDNMALNTAYFVRRPNNGEELQNVIQKHLVQPSTYKIVDTITLDDVEFDDYMNNLREDKDFLKSFRPSPTDADFTVIEVKSNDGRTLLIDNSGYNSAQYISML